jgi:hypothetical protein
MPKTWNRGDAKKFAKQVQLGKSYYIVYKIATNLAPYEDSKLYSEIVFTDRRPFTGTPSTGSMDAVSLCQNYGPVYETPPRGMRNIADAAPQVGAPLGSNHSAYLDAAEIRGLGKRLSDASDPHTRRR